MTEKVMEQLAQLDQKNDPALMEKVNNAASLSELVEILKEQGIEVTEEELTEAPAKRELDEAELDNVTGGDVRVRIISNFSYGLSYGLYGTSDAGKCFSFSLGNRIGYFIWTHTHRG